jgi:glycerate kinase
MFLLCVYRAGSDGLMSIITAPMNLAECMENALDLIQAATERLCRIINKSIEIGLRQNGKDNTSPE